MWTETYFLQVFKKIQGKKQAVKACFLLGSFLEEKSGQKREGLDGPELLNRIISRREIRQKSMVLDDNGFNAPDTFIGKVSNFL